MRLTPTKPLLFILLLALSVATQTTGKVVSVTDGDTITVLTPQKKQIKIRLAGIDAPEKSQDYGDAAKRYLSALLFGETVRLEGDKVDRYGRLVAKAIDGQGRDVNLAVVANGLAWHYKEYANEQSAADRLAYAQAEQAARRAKLNLWRYPNPTPPWEFRNGETIELIPDRPTASAGRIIGNRNSMIYHEPGCPSYDKVAEKNRVYFTTVQEAARAGYRAARNC
jgi:endonuclease YncB( thermonuclease family)